MTMIEAVIAGIGAQIAILLPLWLAHRTKMAGLEQAHEEKLAELEAKESSVGFDFQTKIFDVARLTVDRLCTEVDRLSAEVKRLHDENSRLANRVNELESEIRGRGFSADGPK